MGAQFGRLAIASVGVPQLLKLLGGRFQPEAESELLALAPWVEVVTTCTMLQRIPIELRPKTSTTSFNDDDEPGT